MRGYTVRDFTDAVISTSEYYRIVRNERDISSSHLHKLLSNLNISYYEFELIMMKDSPLFLNIFADIKKAFNHEDLKLLQQISAKAHTNFLETHYLRYHHISILATALKQKLQCSNANISIQVKEIEYYLLIQNEFSIYDTLLFSNSLFILSKETVNILIKHVLSSVYSYTKFPYQTSQIFALIENLCLLRLKENKPISTYVKTLETVQLTDEHISEKIHLQFFLKLSQYESQQNNQILNQIDIFFKAIKNLNLVDEEIVLKKIYALFMEKHTH